ncbi:hypothetical protein P154DRAFT_188288 [Amniculicola lignicola CBS 123094]|uniref:Uncharacterized protein n=1 Tax=Amniculicola lignicola CBS 123094 TaxID=1392246 RepID=A0A6A5VUY2_9PLEO|nr:hypothetical protein P154DRAFT_188288 [Amniculicola lignicola CBS 123094]
MLPTPLRITHPNTLLRLLQRCILASLRKEPIAPELRVLPIALYLAPILMQVARHIVQKISMRHDYNLLLVAIAQEATEFQCPGAQ